MSSPEKVIVVAINYEADDMTLRFAHSVANATANDSSRVAVVIVDNTTSRPPDRLSERVRAIVPDVVTAHPGANLGYYNGAHYGLQQCLEQGADFSWVVVSNVDVEFDNGFFTNLLSIDYRQQNVGVLAPSIWSSHRRRDLNPFMRVRPSRSRMRRVKAVYRNQFTINGYLLLHHAKNAAESVMRSLAGISDRTTPDDRNSLQAIYAPHGSIVAYSKLFFEAGGTLAYPCFLFGEETYVAEQAQGLGLQTVYAPFVRASHDEHVSTGTFRSTAVAKYAAQSAAFIADTYFGDHSPS